MPQVERGDIAIGLRHSQAGLGILQLFQCGYAVVVELLDAIVVAPGIVQRTSGGIRLRADLRLLQERKALPAPDTVALVDHEPVNIAADLERQPHFGPGEEPPRCHHRHRVDLRREFLHLDRHDLLRAALGSRIIAAGHGQNEGGRNEQRRRRVKPSCVSCVRVHRCTSTRCLLFIRKIERIGRRGAFQCCQGDTIVLRHRDVVHFGLRHAIAGIEIFYLRGHPGCILTFDHFVCLAGTGHAVGRRRVRSYGHSHRVVGIAYFQADLSADLLQLRIDPELFELRLLDFLLVAEAVKDIPLHHQRGGPEIVVLVEAVLLALNTVVEYEGYAGQEIGAVDPGHIACCAAKKIPVVRTPRGWPSPD